MRRPAASVIVASTLLVAACAGTPHATSSSVPTTTTVGYLTGSCSDRSPCELTAGTWVTAGEFGFIPGLAITLPDRWSSREADAGELSLVPPDHPDDRMMLWKDVAAVESNGADPKVLYDVPQTPDGLTASFRQNPDFVVSTPTKTTIAGGIPALTYVIGVSRSARYSDRDCPSAPMCANILKDPSHWGPGSYNIGAPEVVRLYLATVGNVGDRHLFVIALDATDAVELVRLTDVAAPIIASIRLPAVIGYV
jgi:hypothetical protein